MVFSSSEHLTLSSCQRGAGTTDLPSHLWVLKKTVGLHTHIRVHFLPFSCRSASLLYLRPAAGEVVHADKRSQKYSGRDYERDSQSSSTFIFNKEEEMAGRKGISLVEVGRR